MWKDWQDWFAFDDQENLIELPLTPKKKAQPPMESCLFNIN